MEIILYKMTCEKMRVSKSQYLEDELVFSGTLRAPTSVLNPVININSNNEVLNYNYAYIEEFGRYYFITNITSLNNNLWEISLRVDVLNSFSGEIGQNYAFVSRSQNFYKEYLEDALLISEFNKHVEEYEPEDGDDVNVHFGESTHNNNYVITCMNNQTTHVSSGTPQFYDVLPSVSLTDTGVNLPIHSYVLDYQYIYTILKLLALDDTKASFVSSLMVYPFEVPTQTGEYIDLYVGDEILREQIGQHEYNNMKCKYMRNEQSTYLICADFVVNGAFNNFMDYEPYSRYEIYLPYCGWFTLSAEQCLDKELKVVYVLNHRTGTAQVSIIDATDEKLILTTTAQIGVNYPINTTNAKELTTQHNANALNLGINLISSGLTIGGSVASGNALGIAGGVLSGGRSIANYFTSESQMFERAQCSILDGNMGLYNPQRVRIRITRVEPVEYDENFFALHGRPFNQYLQIGVLFGTSGYTEIGRVHLENMGIATSGEIDEIENLLKTGVIL